MEILAGSNQASEEGEDGVIADGERGQETVSRRPIGMRRWLPRGGHVAPSRFFWELQCTVAECMASHKSPSK